MPKTFRSEDIDRLLTEADELIARVNSEVLEDIDEERRTEFEEHFHSLRNLRSEVQDKIEKEGASKEDGSYSEGMHQAIEEIAKAMKGLVRYLT